MYGKTLKGFRMWLLSRTVAEANEYDTGSVSDTRNELKVFQEIPDLLHVQIPLLILVWSFCKCDT